MTARTCQLGRVVTKVCWRKADGERGVDIQDWSTSEEAEAREYAVQTSGSGDVELTVFYSYRNRYPQTFVSGETIKFSPLI